LADQVDAAGRVPDDVRLGAEGAPEDLGRALPGGLCREVHRSPVNSRPQNDSGVRKNSPMVEGPLKYRSSRLNLRTPTRVVTPTAAETSSSHPVRCARCQSTATSGASRPSAGTRTTPSQPAWIE